MAGECCLVFVEISRALVRHQRVDESTDSDPREWRTLLTYLTLDLVPHANSHFGYHRLRKPWRCVAVEGRPQSLGEGSGNV